MKTEQLIAHFNFIAKPFLDDAETKNEGNGRLSEKETGAYIRRCLREVGTKEQIFYAAAIRTIFSYSNGDPSLINRLCNMALVNACLKGKSNVDDQNVGECLEALLDGEQNVPEFQEKRKHNRKKTNLPCSYFHNTTKERGNAVISNISLSGLQIQITKQRQFRLGDRVVVSFKLDDDTETAIREMMIVKNIFGFYAGLAFNAQPNTDAFAEYLK